MGVQAGHTNHGSIAKLAPEHHPPYDRIQETWLLSRDEGTLSLRDFVSSPEEPLRISCERLVELLGDAQHDASDFGCWIFKQAGALLAEIEPDASYIDNNDFTHTAKYLFVGACFSSRVRSILDDRGSRPETERLVTRAVSFCERSQSLGTMPLLIKGVIASNLRAWVEYGDLGSFLLGPQNMRSACFLRLVDHAREVEAQKEAANTKISSRPMMMIQRFCAAATPTEFLLWALSQDISLPLPELKPALRRLLVTSLGEAAREYPFLVVEDEKRGARQPQDLTRPATLEFRPGIYVDVFGTLIHHDGSPNVGLARVVIDLMRRVPPIPVYVVSDSQDEEIERALSFLDPLPTIIHKDKLEGCELECLIDNCEPGPQGLRARRYASPSKALELAAGSLEGELSFTTTKA